MPLSRKTAPLLGLATLAALGLASDHPAAAQVTLNASTTINTAIYQGKEVSVVHGTSTTPTLVAVTSGAVIGSTDPGVLNALTFNDDSQAVVTGGSLTSGGEYGSALDLEGSSSATISGGIFQGGSGSAPLALNSTGNVTISGGTFSEANVVNVSGDAFVAAGDFADNTVSISGGNFLANGINDASYYHGGSGHVSITGGTFASAGEYFALQDQGTGAMDISGGDFSVDFGPSFQTPNSSAAVGNFGPGLLNIYGGSFANDNTFFNGTTFFPGSSFGAFGGNIDFYGQNLAFRQIGSVSFSQTLMEKSPALSPTDRRLTCSEGNMTVTSSSSTPSLPPSRKPPRPSASACCWPLRWAGWSLRRGASGRHRRLDCLRVV